MCLKHRLAGRWPALEREVADEWVQQHVERTCSGRTCTRGCSPQSKDIYCSTVLADICYFLLSALIVAALVSIILFAVLSVAPHFQSASYKKTTCTVSSIEDQDVIKCTCGKLCHSRTICLKINAKYERDDGKTMQGLLHVTEEDLGATCTYAPCIYNNLVDNKLRVQEIERAYPLYSSFDCLYNPTEGSTKVIRKHEYTDDGPLIHMMVWPSLLMLLGIGSCLFIYCSCGSKYACTDKVPPKHVLLIAAQLRRQGIVKLHTLPVEERRRLLRECAPEPAELQSVNIQ